MRRMSDVAPREHGVTRGVIAAFEQNCRVALRFEGQAPSAALACAWSDVTSSGTTMSASSASGAGG